MKKRIAIIGAGSAGLVVAKSCLEYGLEATIYQMRIEQLKIIFNQLIGTWALERQIKDHSREDGLKQGYLSGQCIFTQIEEYRLLCEERGGLVYNGTKTDASRNYIYELRDDKIIILYNDPYRKGEVMHELTFVSDGQANIARHCHLCGDDTYDLEFIVMNEGEIVMTYVIKGPHKDYQMTTRLTLL